MVYSLASQESTMQQLRLSFAQGYTWAGAKQILRDRHAMYITDLKAKRPRL